MSTFEHVDENIFLEQSNKIRELQQENAALLQRAEAAERGLVLHEKMVDEYQKEIMPGFRERIEKVDTRIAELTGALERIAKREGHYFYPDVSGPDEKGMYTVVGPGKPQLTKQCAHRMRSIARQALGSGDTTAKAGEQP
jgi:hypothetical protein